MAAAIFYLLCFLLIGDSVAARLPLPNRRSVAADSGHFLLYYAPFDDVTQHIQVVRDFSGQGNTGSLGFTTGKEDSDPTVYLNGKKGQGLLFDGVDDKVVVPHTPTLWFADASFTISLHFRWDGVLRSHSNYQMLIAKHSSYATKEWTVYLNITTTGSPTVIFDLYNDYSSTEHKLEVPNSGITPHKYYHVLAVYNRPAAKMLLYLNSNQIGMKSVDYHSKAKTDVAMVIGAYCTADSLNGQHTRDHFKGVIDEVKIYLGVLDPQNF